VVLGDVQQLLNLDPLVNADPAFDRADVIGNLLPQYERNRKLWAIPVYLNPRMLVYSVDRFKQAGVPLPGESWTINQFVEALAALKEQTGDAAFYFGLDKHALLSLTAAFGGLPFDYRTNPVTVNFTDPKTVTAIRQTLNLAKQGYFQYFKLSNFGFPNNWSSSIAISSQSYFELYLSSKSKTQAPFQIVTFPWGSQYAPVEYTAGAAFISVNAQNPEACYRWISTLRKRPEVFWGMMPAYNSILENSAYSVQQNPQLLNISRKLAILLDKPNTVVFPGEFLGNNMFELEIRYQWLFQAFDNYMLKGADLEGELKQSEAYTKSYVTCLDQLQSPTERDFSDSVRNCAIRADPAMRSTLSK